MTSTDSLPFLPPTHVSIGDLSGLVDTEVWTGDWMTVTQDRIQAFADATDDHQWIHVDPERAQRESPFRTAIAHGFLTLSLLTCLVDDAIRVVGVRTGVNYGFDRVRFVSPVPVGSRIRARVRLAALEPLAGGSVQVTWDVTVEREGGKRPILTAEWIGRFYPNKPPRPAGGA